jgi:hypothetical protein
MRPAIAKHEVGYALACPPAERSSLRAAPIFCGAGCQPAADWQSACRHSQRIFNRLRWAFDRAAAFQAAYFALTRPGLILIK